jgi:hypothetical protein
MAMSWQPGGARKPPQRPQPRPPAQRPPVGAGGAEPGNSGPYVPDPSRGKPVGPVLSRPKPTMPGPGPGPGQGGGQSPPYIPSFPMPGGPGMKPDMGVEILMPEKPGMGGGKPSWQILQEAGIGGQGSAAANRAALSGLPQQPQVGIDGAIQNLRAQLGQPPQGEAPGVSGPFSGDPLAQIRNRIAQSGNPGLVPKPQGQGTPPPTWQDGPLGMGGPGSDLGFQSGGGFMAGGADMSPQPPQLPQNPYLDLLRRRMGGGGGPGLSAPVSPVARNFRPMGA